MKPFLVLAVASSLALPLRAESLWTDPPAKRTAITIPSVAPLVDKYEPAVLVVSVVIDPSAEPQLPPGHPPLPDGIPFPFEGPPGEDGGGGGDGRPDIGEGAGFIITQNGYAVTNNHVVENALSITAHVGNSHEDIGVTVVGTDDKTDIALIKLNSPRKDWPVIPLGDSDALKVGDFVVAIGTPFGLSQSVSLGILSARSRRDIEPSGRSGLYDFLQTDASINPGNSGGPLLNLYGEVIGINAAVNAMGNGIGFAIPINMVKRILPSLKDKGRFARSWIGVQITGIDKEIAPALGLDRVRGALVREVVPEGPAAKGGVIPGDVITTFEGKTIEDSYELPLLAGEAGVGKTVKLEVLRDGKPRPLAVTLGDHPDNNAPKKSMEVAKKDEKEKDGSLGVVVATLESEDRDRLKLKSDVSGARVTKQPRQNSPAFNAELHQDDVIIEANKKPIHSANDFAAVVRDTPSKGVLKLLVRRGGQTLFIPLPKP